MIGFTKDQLKRITIVTSHYQGNQAWVQNQFMLARGYFDDLCLGSEKTLTEGELIMAFKDAAKDFVVEGIYLIENISNSDMSEINKIKKNIENRLQAQGYEIITHAPKKLEFDTAKVNEWAESHNLIYLMSKRIKELNKSFDDKNKELTLLNEKLNKANFALEQAAIEKNKKNNVIVDIVGQCEELKEKVNAAQKELNGIKERTIQERNELNKVRDEKERLTKCNKYIAAIAEQSKYSNINIEDLSKKSFLFDKICNENGLDNERINKMKEFIAKYEKCEHYHYYVGKCGMFQNALDDFNIKSIMELRTILSERNEINERTEKK